MIIRPAGDPVPGPPAIPEAAAANGFGVGPATVADPATEAFVAHRSLLFTVLCEILGSAADA